MVFCGLFPVDADDYPDLRDALEKLSLNDASLRWEPETSAGARLRLPLRLPRAAAHGHRARAAGARVRPGAAGHDAERRVPGHRPRPATVLRRALARRPAAADQHRAHRGALRALPRSSCRRTGIGAVMGLCQDRRGVFVTMEPIEHRQQIVYDLPLAEIVLDFYDQLKSRTRGYASLDYELHRLPREPAGEAGHPARRRPGGRALDDRAPRPGLRPRQDASSSGSSRRSRASSSRCRSRRPSAARSSPARP